MEGRSYTRGARRESVRDRWKSAITDHACQTNYVIDWQNARIVEKETRLEKRHWRGDNHKQLE